MLRADEEVLQYLSAFSLLIVQKATSRPAPHHADQFILDGLDLARLSDTYRPRLDAREDRPRALYRTSLRLLRDIEKAAIRIMLRAMGAPVDAIFALEAMEGGRQLDARDLMALAALLRDPVTVGELEFRGVRWTDNRSRRRRDPLDLDAYAYDFDEPPDMYDESMLVGVLALEYTKVVNQRQLDLEEDEEESGEEEKEEEEEEEEEEDDNDDEESDEDEDMSSDEEEVDEEDEDMSASEGWRDV